MKKVSKGDDLFDSRERPLPHLRTPVPTGVWHLRDLFVTVQVGCLLQSVAGVIVVLLEPIAQDTETGHVQLEQTNVP